MRGCWWNADKLPTSVVQSNVSLPLRPLVTYQSGCWWSFTGCGSRELLKCASSQVKVWFIEPAHLHTSSQVTGWDVGWGITYGQHHTIHATDTFCMCLYPPTHHHQQYICSPLFTAAQVIHWHRLKSVGGKLRIATTGTLTLTTMPHSRWQYRIE